jgi:hypothetical protein
MINLSGGPVNTLRVVRFDDTRDPDLPFGVRRTSVNAEPQPAGRCAQSQIEKLPARDLQVYFSFFTYFFMSGATPICG